MYVFVDSISVFWKSSSVQGNPCAHTWDLHTDILLYVYIYIYMYTCLCAYAHIYISFEWAKEKAYCLNLG